MDGISSTPLENSVAFLKLRDHHKASLLEDSRLTKAAGLAAQQELLLNSHADDSWKVPRLKSLNKELRVWSQKIRQPGQPGHPGSPEDEANLAIGPTLKFMGNIAQLKQRINRPAATPPIVKQGTPQLWTPKSEPSSSKSAPPSTVFKTKPLKYKTSTKSTSGKKASSGKKAEDIYESTSEFASAAEDFPETPKTGKQLAHALIASAKTKAIKAAKSKAKEYALKKLQTQPGWQPFGAQPLKRKLHGKDWTATPFKPYKKKS